MKSLNRYLDAVPEDIRQSINEILKISSPNPATLKLMVEIASDINSKTNKNPLRDKTFLELIKNSGIKDAVDHLRRIRNPKLSALTSQINGEITKEELKALKIDFDHRFENTWLDLSARISSISDAENLKKELDQIIKNGKLEKLIKLYRQDE